ncbi:FtsX-like permease family protein [Paenibacillus sp. FJAT-27812]|uniref:FtsX-like permease family protein n=1 Tax=Paenibacillus sp. FJAT-27812 TaxID=1684143 RepID=UPI0006A790AA|nr:ABC transporter permease [Paenibacillus sp. FJAT-27812]
MDAVWSLCYAHLRKKKLQNGIIALLILLSTLLLATSVTVISNTKNVFMDIHRKTNGSHQILTLMNQLHDPQMIKSWWDKQDGVKVSELLPYRNLSGATFQGKEIANLYLFMMNTPAAQAKVDRFVFAQGGEALSPEAGSIWIPTSMAMTNKIAIGDSIGFKTGERMFELKVSAVVVDIPYGGPFATGARIWMNSTDYHKQLDTLQGEDMYMLGLRYDDYSESSRYWHSFEEGLGTPYLEWKTDFEAISSFYFIINKLIGFVMIFVGVVMMLVALYTIGFTISDAILSNYKTIGVLKSLGLSSNKLIAIYVMQYAFLSVIAIIPGLGISYFLSKMIVESSLSYLKAGDLWVAIQGYDKAMLAGVVVFIAVLLCVLVYASKARYVQPMQAIRYGMSEMENNKMIKRLQVLSGAKSIFERMPLPFVIGLRPILKNAKDSVLIVVLTTITSAVLVLGFVLLNSIFAIQQTAPLWGYDSSHVAVTIFNKSAFSRADLEKEVLADPRIKNIGWMSSLNGVFAPDQMPGAERAKRESINGNMDVLDGSFDHMGMAVLKGYNPRNSNEIALGVNVAKSLGKDVGDVVDVYIEGHKHTLTVTGVYQAIANMSYSARITADVVKKYNQNYNAAELCFINLADSTLADQIVQQLNTKYKDSISAVTQQTLLDSVYKDAATILILPMSMMGLLFVGVTFMIIYSICRMSIRKESKSYGIYKSIGMTSNQMRRAISAGIVALSAIGVVIGIVVGVYVLPILLSDLFSGYGIVQLPLIREWGGIIAVALLSVIAAGFGSWLSSKVIQKTSPRILVVE